MPPATFSELEQIFHDEHSVSSTTAAPSSRSSSSTGGSARSAGRRRQDRRRAGGSRRRASALVGSRSIFIPARDDLEEVNVYQAELLGDGAVLEGPAVIAGETTTICSPPATNWPAASTASGSRPVPVALPRHWRRLELAMAEADTVAAGLHPATVIAVEARVV